jgi:hypothetical protein
VVVAFAGPLCRRYAAASGGDPTLLRQGVLRWRADLQEALGARLRGRLDWNEDPAGSMVEYDLGDSGLMALRLLAVYAQRSDLELPDRVPAIPELDRAYRAAADEKFARSHFGQLLAAELWLPLDFPFTARAPLPDGSEAGIGSLPMLLDQLRRLNARTFQADAAAQAEWLELAAAPGDDLIRAARRGLAALSAAAGAAVAMGSPLSSR